ncbi:MAG: hypothetical protein PHX68_01450 [Alphaproteobacteria bacterium]|nr:hypothetical protein [Alphaproteobacteria bacterium]
MNRLNRLSTLLALSYALQMQETQADAQAAPTPQLTTGGATILHAGQKFDPKRVSEKIAPLGPINDMILIKDPQGEDRLVISSQKTPSNSVLFVTSPINRNEERGFGSMYSTTPIGNLAYDKATHRVFSGGTSTNIVVADIDGDAGTIAGAKKIKKILFQATTPPPYFSTLMGNNPWIFGNTSTGGFRAYICNQKDTSLSILKLANVTMPSGARTATAYKNSLVVMGYTLDDPETDTKRTNFSILPYDGVTLIPRSGYIRTRDEHFNGNFLTMGYNPSQNPYYPSNPGYDMVVSLNSRILFIDPSTIIDEVRSLDPGAHGDRGHITSITPSKEFGYLAVTFSDSLDIGLIPFAENGPRATPAICEELQNNTFYVSYKLPQQYWAEHECTGDETCEHHDKPFKLTKCPDCAAKDIAPADCPSATNHVKVINNKFALILYTPLTHRWTYTLNDRVTTKDGSIGLSGVQFAMDTNGYPVIFAKYANSNGYMRVQGPFSPQSEEAEIQSAGLSLSVAEQENVNAVLGLDGITPQKVKGARARWNKRAPGGAYIARPEGWKPEPADDARFDKMPRAPFWEKAAGDRRNGRGRAD